MIQRPQNSVSSHQWSLDQRFFVAGLAQRLETSQLGIITISTAPGRQLCSCFGGDAHRDAENMAP